LIFSNTPGDLSLWEPKTLFRFKWTKAQPGPAFVEASANGHAGILWGLRHGKGGSGEMNSTIIPPCQPGGYWVAFYKGLWRAFQIGSKKMAFISNTLGVIFQIFLKYYSKNAP